MRKAKATIRMKKQQKESFSRSLRIKKRKKEKKEYRKLQNLNVCVLFRTHTLCYYVEIIFLINSPTSLFES